MGLSDTDSVVNADGRAHDVPNLCLSDNSTFPSALGVNPAPTIVALSLRTADQFLAKERRRDALAAAQAWRGFGVGGCSGSTGPASLSKLRRAAAPKKMPPQ